MGGGGVVWAEIEREARRQECVQPKSLSRFDLKQHLECYREQIVPQSFESLSRYFDVRLVCVLLLQIELTSSHELVRFDGTLTLTSACKHVVGVEVLHCE